MSTFRAVSGGSDRAISDSGAGFGAANCMGTILPPEKSSSAGSIVTGSSWRQNSKSSAWPSGRPSGGATGVGSAESWLNEIRGLNQGKASGRGGRATILTIADAMTERDEEEEVR